MSGTHDITIDQGATFSIVITMRDASNNNVFSTATAATAQVREYKQSETVLADFDCTFAANNASLTVSLDEIQTANLSVHKCYWDLRVVWPDRIEYILTGKATVNFTVTRD